MMNAFLLATESTAQTGGSNLSFILVNIIPIALMILVFYFFLIRPQRKKDKEIQQMRSNIQVGDEVITGGGIIGRVVSMRDDNVVIETGTDRSKVRVARWAIQVNNTIHDEA